MSVKPIPIDPVIDFQQLRLELFRKHISVRRFAETCGFSRVTVSAFLNERREPGQLARIKIAAAASRLSLVDVYSDHDSPRGAETRVVTTFLVAAVR